MNPVAPGCSSARAGVLTATCLLLLATGWPAWGAGMTTAADFIIRTWNRQEGLPPTVINGIQRAPNGYLWLATQRGLVRFDGERFKLFDAQSNPELRTNWISFTLIEQRGSLWVATPDALLYYPNGRPGAEAAVEIGTQLRIKAFSAGNNNIVWALSAGNELLQLGEGKIVARFKIPGDEPIRSLVWHKSMGLVIAAPGGSMLLKDGKFTPLPHELFPRPELVCPSKSGGFWLAEGGKVARLTETDGQFALTWLANAGEGPQSAITALTEDQAGRLWVGTRQGVVHCLQPDNETSIWQEVTPKRLRSLGLVSCLYEDSEGLLWVGTTGGYLHQIRRRLVTVWSLPLITQESTPQTVCVTRDGAVWVGTDGAGAYRYEDGTVSHFGSKEGLSSGTVISILEDGQTNLWLGTFNGLFRLEQGKFQAQLESVLRSRPVPVVFEDKAGTLWIGTEGDLIRKRGDEVKIFPLGGGLEVRAIAEGRRDELWIGTRGAGLFHLRGGVVEKVTRFQHPRVQAVHCDARGVLWVGTGTRGLFRIANNQVNRWSRADGLPSAWIHSILEDADGTLWIGSNEGIFGVAKQALLVRLHDKESPLLTIQVPSSEVGNWSAGSGQPSAAKGPDGRVWFPAGHGVLSFNPAELTRARSGWPVLIEEVLVDGVERAINPATMELKIYTGMKRLEFRYTIADLDASGRQAKFRYQLEGLDEKWVDADTQRSASYPALPLGQYRFRVTSAGSGNVWSETASPLTIKIVPYFWQTAWFKALTAMLVSGLVGTAMLFIGRAKLRRKLERLEMQHAMEKERQRIARDLHDDLGAGITEIMLLSELAKRENNQQAAAGKMQSQLDDITQKALQVATAMDEVVWTVDPKNDSLPDLASYLCDYARKFLRAANMSCRIDLMEGLPHAIVSAQQRHNLLMAVKEALNNAVKHSGASEVWLRILWVTPRAVLAVTVEDNGRGVASIPVDDSEPGNGLANMRARLRAIGGETEFVSRADAGMKVRFTLPLRAPPEVARGESLN